LACAARPIAGDEALQLYLTHPNVSGAPLRALQFLERVHLECGEEKTVKFHLGDRALGIVNESGMYRIVSRKVEARIGGGQPIATSARQAR
jgi:beta-glucosidase